MAKDSNKNSFDISELEKLQKEVEDQQQKMDAEKASTTQAVTVSSVHSNPDWWSVGDAMTVSAAVLVFGSAIMLLATCLLYVGRNADDVLKLFGTLIIVISAVFLVVAGYSDTQIAPVIGLLGTIAGYLLGRESVDGSQGKKDSSPEKKVE